MIVSKVALTTFTFSPITDAERLREIGVHPDDRLAVRRR